MVIIMKKNAIFFIKKIPNKIRTKKNYYFRNFFIFYFVFLKKKKKMQSCAQVGQKSWGCIILLLQIIFFQRCSISLRSRDTEISIVGYQLIL